MFIKFNPNRSLTDLVEVFILRHMTFCNKFKFGPNCIIYMKQKELYTDYWLFSIPPVSNQYHIFDKYHGWIYAIANAFMEVWRLLQLLESPAGWRDPGV